MKEYFEHFDATLVGITKPMIPEIETTEQLLAYCARVSSSANQLKHETGPRLIRSLIKRREWSPLEMISLTMEINTTRDIGRQILRHRSFSFQEFSQRYSKVNTANFVLREARLQDTKDRQNSIEIDDSELQKEWEDIQIMLVGTITEAYEWALGNGIAKEQARAILPEGMTPTQMYMAGTLRSWYHYCQLRREKGTQKEHRVIAENLWNIIEEQIPSVGSFEEFSAPENGVYT